MPFPSTHPAVERALAAQGYAEPTPVQSAVLEAGQDQDLLVSAQTGSGKTVAYGLAMTGLLLGEGEKMGQPGPPAALVVAPTRELAIQVARELTWLYAEAGAIVTTCVGGMDPRREQRALASGVHIVVGTPGRLRDHLDRGALDLSAVDVVVLDEADEMLDLGFREDLEALLDAAPPERRTLMFSATIAKEIASLARRYQKNAVRIDVGSKGEPHGDIEYRAYRVAPSEMEHAVVNVLRHFEEPGALVFCSTREAVRHLHVSLRERGFSVVALSGELTQKERMDALQALRDGRARVCVATDVAARGLDLPELGLVIHFDLPTNKQALLHRSGRTGRAGRKGVSVLLVPFNRRRAAEGLLLSANIDAIWSGPPKAEEIRAADQRRLLADPMLTEPATEEETTLAQAVVDAATPEAIALALVRFHRARLPSPEDLYDEGAPRERSEGPPRRDRDRSEYDPQERVPYERPEGDTVWFRLKVGRQNDADPKWLIPLICRLGHVTKKDIGQIRIFDRETKFEIFRPVEARFRAAVSAAEGDAVQIEPASDPGAKDGAGRRSSGGPRKGPGFKGARFGDKGPPRSESNDGGGYKGKGPARPEGGEYKASPRPKPNDGGGYKGKKPRPEPGDGGGFKGPPRKGYKPAR